MNNDTTLQENLEENNIDKKPKEEVLEEQNVEQKDGMKDLNDTFVYMKDVENEILIFDKKSREIIEEDINSKHIKAQETSELTPFVKESLKFFNGKFSTLNFKENFENLIFTQNVLLDTLDFESKTKRQKFPPQQFLDLKENILIKCHRFHLEVGIHEPYFLGLEIVDVFKQKPVTEKFYFHLNSKDITSSYFSEISTIKELLLKGEEIPKGIFQITEPNTNMYLLLTVEKIVQGKLEYFIQQFKNIKDFKGVKKGDMLNLNFTQQFLWSFAPIFNIDENNVVLNKGMTYFKYFYPFNLKYIEIYQLILSNKDGGQIKRLQNIPGYFLIEILPFKPQSFEKDIKERLKFTSSRRDSVDINVNNVFECIEQVQKMNKKNLEDITKNISQKTIIQNVDKKDYLNYINNEFQYQIQKVPVFNYVNEMIIYPETVNLINVIPDLIKNTKFKNFNVILQVKLLSRDEKDQELECFPSKFDKNKLNSYFNTNIVLQTIQPTFTDQIKIVLPLPVEKKHYLLFSFYHMNTEKSKDQDQGLCTFIGCSISSLYDIVKFHESTESLPLLKKIPLLDENPLPFSERLNIFKYTTKLVSTVHPKETSLTLLFSNLYKFFELPEDKKKDLKTLKESVVRATKDILDVRLIQSSNYFSHYPMLLDILFNSLALVPELLAYHPDTHEEEKKTPRSLDGFSLRRKLSVKEKIKMFEDPQKTPERSFIKPEIKVPEETPRGRKTSYFKPIEDPKKQYTKSDSDSKLLPEKSLGEKTLAFGKRISMKLFGTSFEGNQNSSRSTPVSPLTLSIKDEELEGKSFFKVLLEYEKTTFDTILHLLKGSYVDTTDYTKPNLLLGSYSQSIFKEDYISNSPFYFILTRTWYKILENVFGLDEQVKQQEEEPPMTLRRKPSLLKIGQPIQQCPVDSIQDSLSFSWFIFNIIKKSFVLKKPKDEGKQYAPVLRELISTLGSIVYESKEKKEFSLFLNQQVCLFLCDLAYDLKEEYLFDIIISYFDAIDQKEMKDLKNEEFTKKMDVIIQVINFKLEFLKIFYDHDQIVALHAPQDFKCRSYPPLKLVLSLLRDIHNFEKKVKSLCKEDIIDDKKLKEESHKMYITFIDFLKYIMTKHEMDGRYQKVSQKEVLGRIYFPFLIQLMNIDFDEILEKEFIEKFIIFIIKNLNNDFFMSWIKTLSDNSIIKFLKIITRCINKFSFDVTNPNEGKKKLSKMLIEVAFNVVVEKFLLIYQYKREKILTLPVQEDSINIQDTSYYSYETNLLEISLYMISLIVKKDTEYNFGYCNKKKGKEFHEILKELASIQDKGYNFWKWMYGILLQGITLSIDDLNPYFYDLMLIMENPIEIPETPRVYFEEDLPDNIDYDQNTLEIKSGTVDKLIERLFALKQNKNYSKQFFLTYRSFTTPFDLLEQLKQRHFEQSHSEIQGLRIFNCVKHWLTDYFYDFDNAMIVKLFSFLQLVKNSPASQGIKAKLEKNLLFGGEKDSKRIFSTPPPEKILPLLKSEKFDLTNWSPIEIARQVALIEYKIFSKIQPKECFNLSWTKKNKEITSPNIVELTNRFNNFSYWLATLIIKEEDLKKRQNLVAHIIKLGQCCEQIHNFNAVSTISSALNNAAVFRLKKTFDGISKEIALKRFELSDLVTNTGNYKNLRLALQCHPPCIPYLGVFLTDLTFIEEGSPNIINETMVNFHKRRQFAEVLMKINILQQSPYNYSEIKELQQVLIECKDIWDDGPLYKQSLKIEPREKN